MAEKKKDKMVEFVVREFERYETHHRPRMERMEKIYNYWIGKPPGRDYDWQNAVNVPVTIESEQTITPRLFTALFPTDAPVDVKVEGDTPPEQGIKIKFLLQHYFRVANVQGIFNQMLTQCTLFGTGYADAGTWYMKRGWQVDETTNERYLAVVENRPNCSFVDFFELFPHPAKINIGDGLPLVRRRYVDAEFLKLLAEDPHFKFNNLKEALNSKPPPALGSYERKRDKYELLEYWGPYDTQMTKENGEVETKKAVPHWVMVINRTVKVRGIPNPYNHQKEPFLKIKLFPDAKPNWYGVGTGMVGQSTQERLNKLVNQRLDNVDLVLNRQGVFNANDTLINKKGLRVSKPGKFHSCSDTLTSIKWIDTPDVTSSSYKEEELAKQDHREATGASQPLLPGDPKDQHRTAMGIQLLQGAAGLRFRPVLRMMEIDGIQELAMFFFSNLKQFMPTAEWVLITGDAGETESVQVSPEEIQAKVFFIPTGISETQNKEVQVGQLLRFKEVTMNDQTVNRQEINKRIAELFGFKNIQRLLVPQQPVFANSPVAPENQQRIQQRLAEGASPQAIERELLGPPPAGAPPQQ